MRTQQKEGTLILTSSMASTASKGKHLLTFWCLITKNKHIQFHKGEYIGHLEPTIPDSMTGDIHTPVQPHTHSTNSVTLQKMMAEQEQLDTFHQPHYKLKPKIESQLDALLKEYASQFVKDETSTTLLRNDH